MAKQQEALKIKELTPEEKEIVDALFEESSGQEYVRIGPKGYTVMKKYEKYAADIYNMELKKGDVFVVTYQRSGTTLTQELVWLIASDLDYKKAEAIPLQRRYEFLEIISTFPDHVLRSEYIEKLTDPEKVRQLMAFFFTPATETLAGQSSPRFVKTHLPLTLLPPTILDTAKVVYVARNPLDVIVSCYHHAKLFKPFKFKGTFKQLWNAFSKDLYTMTPYFEHVKEAWALRNHPNMLFLFYEDLSKDTELQLPLRVSDRYNRCWCKYFPIEGIISGKSHLAGLNVSRKQVKCSHLKDMPASIRRVSDFLGKKLDDNQIKQLSEHLSIDNFKNNKSVNFDFGKEIGIMNTKESFIRKGKSGGWHEYFDGGMQREADEWIARNLTGTDLRFPSVH